MFVPIRFPYPTKTKPFRPLTLFCGATWGVMMVVLLLTMPDCATASPAHLDRLGQPDLRGLLPGADVLAVVAPPDGHGTGWNVNRPPVVCSMQTLAAERTRSQK